MKTGQYCQRQRCRHVKLEQFWQAFASRGFVSDSWAFLLHFTRRLTLLSLLTEEMTSLVTSSHIRHVCSLCWRHKSAYFIVTRHRQRSTKLSTTYANAWTRAFWPMVDI